MSIKENNQDNKLTKQQKRKILGGVFTIFMLCLNLFLNHKGHNELAKSISKIKKK